MKTVALTLPTFGFIVATRAALGVGIGLLVSKALSDSRRRAVGTALVATGALTTIPAAMAVMRNTWRAPRHRPPLSVSQDDRIIGATRFPRKGDDDVM